MVFLDFFYHLRAHGLRVGTSEWLSLLSALVHGHARTSVGSFYHVSRALLVHREADFDRFDRAFAEYFQGIESTFGLNDELLSWLEEAVLPRELTEAERDSLAQLDLETLLRTFEERLREQNERHDGGNRWIGTGGTSPFGNGGTNPAGIRVGGSGGGRSAVAVATQRRFQNLRHDRVIDPRQIGLALRRLRQLVRDAAAEELDMDATIDATARQMGEIELVMRPERRNRVRLLLLVDVGGSMDPYARLCEELFTAAHKATHFRAFRALFFHNCPYGTLYRDIATGDAVDTVSVLEEVDQDWIVLLVGDAYMHPWELTQLGGALYARSHEQSSGLSWLRRIRARCPRSAWLNPEPQRIWEAPSIRIVRSVFPMYPLTLEGIGDAVDALRGVRPPTELAPAL